jgi:hypothetical protein
MWDWFQTYLCVIHLRSCNTKRDLEKFADRWCNATRRCCRSGRFPSSMIDVWLDRPSRLCAVDLLYTCEKYTLLDVLVLRYNCHALCETCHDKLPAPDHVRILDTPRRVWQAWANQHRTRFVAELDAYIIPDLARLVGDYVCGIAPPSSRAPTFSYKIAFTDRTAGGVTQYAVKHSNALIVLSPDSDKLDVRVFCHDKHQSTKARWIQPHTAPTRWMRTTLSMPHRPLPDELTLHIVTWEPPESVVYVRDVVLTGLFIAFILTCSVYLFYHVYWPMLTNVFHYFCTVFAMLGPYWAILTTALAIETKRALPLLFRLFCFAIASPYLFLLGLLIVGVTMFSTTEFIRF